MEVTVVVEARTAVRVTWVARAASVDSDLEVSAEAVARLASVIITRTSPEVLVATVEIATQPQDPVSRGEVAAPLHSQDLVDPHQVPSVAY
ncbi:MAG: hypothetical protein A2790_04550 [Phenylobacterium sp. RIFCSPHIGHO2_01_FULL_69_31]|nr:MAG: hypothetical protein A2790_04550 [Phenylobacterium sp. RIFCSPHIGHO2_01_FULL_69_31]